ncbi:MAG TPA: hypothetical protein VIV60_10625 [Polyangiaceae bacterium]
MNSPTRWALVLGSMAQVLAACGSEDQASHANNGGRSGGTATNAGANAGGINGDFGGAVAHSGGANAHSGGATFAAAGDTASTGEAIGGAGAANTSATNAAAANAGTGGKSSAGSCKPVNVTCKIAVPLCEAMQVPELNASGNCYTGRCIPIGDCSCNTATDCPDNNQYTCRNDTKRCTPYL